MGKEEKIKAIINFIKYKLFIDFMGVLAISFLSPYKNERVEFYIGYVVGLMILGRKFPDTINSVFKIIDEIGD